MRKLKITLLLIVLGISHLAVAQMREKDLKKLSKYEGYLEKGKIYKASNKADKLLEKYPNEPKTLDFSIRSSIAVYRESFEPGKGALMNTTSRLVRGIWFSEIIDLLDSIRVYGITNSNFCYYLNFLDDYSYENPYDSPPTTLKETYGTRLQVLRKYCQMNGDVGETSNYSFSQDSLAKVFYNQGFDAFDKQDYNNAVLDYEKAIEQDTAFIEAYDNLGLTYRRIGNFERAKFFYEKSIELYPKGHTARQNLAVVYELEENFDAALEEYQKLKAIDAKNPEGYYGCAKVFLIQERLEPSLTNGLKAIEHYGAGSNYLQDAHYLVGICYYYKADKNEAAKHLQLAKSGGFDVPKALVDELQLD